MKKRVWEYETYTKELTVPSVRNKMHPIYMKNRKKYPLPFSSYEVHHKDFNESNNKLSNLILLIPEEHEKIHSKEEERVEEEIKKIERNPVLSKKEREEKIKKNEGLEEERRRIREDAEGMRITRDKEISTKEYEEDEKKRLKEREIESKKIKQQKRIKLIKNIIEIIIIVFFILLLLKLYLILKEHQDLNSIILGKEREPITLTYVQAIKLCEYGCSSEGGWNNFYTNYTKTINCNCKNLNAYGMNILRTFNKVTRKWEN